MHESPAVAHGAPPPNREVAITRLEIDATPDAVFAVLSDGRSYADWIVGAKATWAVDEGFPAVGTRLHHSVGVAMASIDDVTEVTECDPPHHLALRASAGPLGDAAVVFDLEATTTGTSITMQEQPLEEDAAAKAGRRADWLLRVRNAETMWRLKELVEHRAGLRPSASGAAAVLPDPVEHAIVRLFAAVAVSREQRSLHPRGVALRGTAAVHPPGQALAATPDAAVLVRLSRGMGLPHPLPDFNGVALRFLDAHGPGRHQDVLLASAPGAPGLRHLLLPTLTFSGSGYSTVLPHRTATGLRLFRCDPLPLRTLDDVVGALPLALELRTATLRGAWEPAASITLHEVVADDTGFRFDPWNTSDALVPAGFLNRLRGPAYAASRAATP